MEGTIPLYLLSVSANGLFKIYKNKIFAAKILLESDVTSNNIDLEFHYSFSNYIFDQKVQQESSSSDCFFLKYRNMFRKPFFM